LLNQLIHAAQRHSAHTVFRDEPGLANGWSVCGTACFSGAPVWLHEQPIVVRAPGQLDYLERLSRNRRNHQCDSNDDATCGANASACDDPGDLVANALSHGLASASRDSVADALSHGLASAGRYPSDSLADALFHGLAGASSYPSALARAD
jgi:hypothetical protein